MHNPRFLAWLILASSTTFLAMGAYWLAALYLSSFIAHPEALADFTRAVAATQELDRLKDVSLALAELTEEERAARVQFVLRGGWMVIGLGLICSGLALRLLLVLRREVPSAATA